MAEVVAKEPIQTKQKCDKCQCDIIHVHNSRGAGRKPKYTTAEERALAKKASNARYVAKNREVYRSASKQYYNKNRELIAERRKTQRQEKAQLKKEPAEQLEKPQP